MNLSALAGNQRIKDQLSQQERERGLSHAYILSGPAGSGRHVLARQLAAAMGERKVYLLEHADRMNPSAQNAMLKLLEEGPAYAAFLLLAENGGGLLQTVRSRCEELALTLDGEPEGDEGDQARQAMARQLAQALERAGELELLEAAMVLDGKRSREELAALLDAVADQLAARAAAGGDRRRLLRAAELVKTLRGAAMLNVNAGQLAGWLCAGMYNQ